MKTAIYIEDGVTQLVLTPETDFETKVISGIDEAKQSISIYKGGFYYCRGGWDRESSNNDSLMIRMTIRP
jgi:hypothetical protein